MIVEHETIKISRSIMVRTRAGSVACASEKPPQCLMVFHRHVVDIWDIMRLLSVSLSRPRPESIGESCALLEIAPFPPGWEGDGF